MKTKKLWIWSLVFGLLATGILYILVMSNFQINQSEPAATEVIEEQEETENEKVAEDTAANTAEVKEFVNELLPIEDGKRAMTIRITDEQGIAGFLKPGVYVDLVARQDVPEDAKSGQHASSTLVLQNIRLLAVGHAADSEEEVKRYQLVTVEVTPREGLALGFVTGQELYLLLRKEGDKKVLEQHLHMHEDELHEGVFRK